MKQNILIIGLGNLYRSDDAVGLIVARRLREKGLSGVTVREAGGEGAALIAVWQGAETVILVDAVHSGAEPGTVYRLDAHAQPIPTKFFHYSTHAFSVAEAIELARTLNRLPECLIVYGIEGKNFEAGEGLSPAVEQAAQAVLERLLQELDQPQLLS